MTEPETRKTPVAQPALAPIPSRVNFAAAPEGVRMEWQEGRVLINIIMSARECLDVANKMMEAAMISNNAAMGVDTHKTNGTA